MRTFLVFISLQGLLLESVQCRFMPNGLGLPGAVSIINGGASSSPTSEEKRGPLVDLQKRFSQKESTYPVLVQDVGNSMSIALFLLSSALSFVTAPYLAPYYENLSGNVSNISQKCLAVVLDASKELAKFADGVIYAGASEIILKFYWGLKNLVDKIMSQFLLASETAYTMISTLCSQSCILSDVIISSVSTAKNGVTSLAINSASMLSDAVALSAKEAKRVCVLTTSLIEQGFDSSGRFAYSTACIVTRQTVATWEMTSSFLVYISEQVWSKTVAISVFFAKSIAKSAEITCCSVSAMAKNALKVLGLVQEQSSSLS